MQDFRKLRVWQRAHAFELTVDKFVRRLPRQCPVAKKSQLTRSTESVPANIAEGCGAATQREFARFLDSAIKSTSEIENHLLSIKALRDRGGVRGIDRRDLADPPNALLAS
jgi:four helix bundle protein